MRNYKVPLAPRTKVLVYLRPDGWHPLGKRAGPLVPV